MTNDVDARLAFEPLVRRAVLIDAARMIYRHAQDHAHKMGDDDGKVSAWDMQAGAAPILDELGLTWPEIMSA